jgi:hypothetical protein
MKVHGILATTVLAACSACTPAQPDFDEALNRHMVAIQDRDLETFASTVTSGDTLYTIFPDGTALVTPEEAIDQHRTWFADPDWVWRGTVVRTIVGVDMATALIEYDYRDSPDSTPRSSWLILLFALEDREWRLVHDQNTSISEPVAN